MKKSVIAASVAAFLAVGCGGGGGGSSSSGGNSPPPPPPPPANAPPVANAGADIAESLSPTGTQLDGSASSDPDGDTLSYAWTVVTQPTGASASFDDAAASQPRLQTLVPGQYEIELSVDDGRGGTDTDRVVADLSNEAPVIAISARSEIGIGLPLELDASGTSDPNGQALQFQWTVTAAPASSQLQTSFTGSMPTVTLDVEGNYEFRLEVTDGFATSAQSVAVTAQAFSQNPLQNSFSLITFPANGGSFAANALTADSNGFFSEDTALGVAVSAEGSVVRIVSLNGETLRKFDVTVPITHLAVSPNGAWIAAASVTTSISEPDDLAMINISTGEIFGPYEVPGRPVSLIVGNDGVAHYTPGAATNIGQVFALVGYSVVPDTGEATRTSASYSNGDSYFRSHPDGIKAYDQILETVLTHRDVTEVPYGTVRRAREPLGVSSCPDFWISADGNFILMGCGIVVRATDDPDTDMVFFNQLATEGSLLDAAYNAASDSWWVIEERNGQREVNIYANETGLWLERVELPDVAAGRPGIPLSLLSDTSGLIRIYTADSASDPQIFQVLTRGTIAQDEGPTPPVTVVANNMAAERQQTVTIDASRSFDRQGGSVGFEWALVSEPDGSAVAVSATDLPTLEFTPSSAGDYVFTLVTISGERRAPVETITVRVVEPGKALQILLEGDPSDVAYNKARNQILYTSATRSELQIIDLATTNAWSVELARPGQRVGVSSNGNYAVVSHNGLASLVELTATGATLIDTQATGVDFGAVAVNDQGVGFLLPSRGIQNALLYALDFGNDQITWSNRRVSPGRDLRLLPTGSALYHADPTGDQDRFDRTDVADLNAMRNTSAPIRSGEFDIGGNLWISEGSDQILTRGGPVFRRSDVTEQDMTFVDTLSPGIVSDWADHSVERDRWIIASEGALELYNAGTFLQTGSVAYDTLFMDTPGDAASIQRAWFSDSGTQVIIVARSNQTAPGGGPIANATVVQTID